MEIQVNNYSITVLESLFRSMKDAEYPDIFDASVYLYNFVMKERIYPPKVVEGFRSAMAIMSELSQDQFWQIKSVYV
jgi:hypothetical protein